MDAQFKSFYESLHESEAGNAGFAKKKKKIFHKLKKPCPDKSDKSEMERNKTQMEINNAIKRCNPEKHPALVSFQ